MTFSVGLRGQLGIFSTLFAAGMWMSKVAQPLHFEDANALTAFGVGYAVMAIVGGFSFVWGSVADRIGGLNAVRIGALLYAIGIAGRVLTDMAPAIIFSALAGAGASLALVGIRPWVRSHASDQEIPKIVGARNLGNQIGVFLGTVGAAGIFTLAEGGESGTLWALIIAPGLVVAGAIWLLLAARSHSIPRFTRTSTKDSPTRGFRPLATRLALIGVLSGFYVSLVTPYLPLYLTNGGLPKSGAAIAVAVMSLAQAAVTWVIARRSTAERPYKLFFLTEVAVGFLTLAIGLVAGVSVALIVVLFVIRAGFIAIAVTAEETIQYAVIPGNAAGLVFGISQTAFLVGDAIGGAVGAPLWIVLGPAGLAAIAGVATIVNAFLLPSLLRGRSIDDRLAGSG